ncbi:MAG: C_GCAxxG_C_C family protein [Oscillospiraceae bacterium]|nr:C_GCAxxG_C_C family protein [Oscillospiraceae bacterium]
MTRAARAEAFFKDGYNCAQAVALAFQDLTGLEEGMLLRVVSSFGGGLGRLREVCGAISGMAFVMGAVRGYDDPKDREGKAAHYKLLQEMAAEFRKRTGSIVCRDLLGETTVGGAPEARTEAYYQKRPCGALVRLAAAITAKELLGEHDECLDEI